MINSQRKILRGGVVITQDKEVKADLFINGNIIEKICIEQGADNTCEVVDCTGCWIIPGFVDLHCFGAKGRATFEGTQESMQEISRCFAMHGTTSFLMGVNVCSLEKMFALIMTAKDAMKTGLDGARLIGIHFEGPYINPQKRGGLQADAIRNPDIREVNNLIAKARDIFRMMTLSPELPGALDVIEVLSKNGIVSSAGHTEATADTISKSIDKGLSHITHIFNNGQNGVVLKNGIFKEEGCLLEFLLRDELTAGVIADGVHVNPKLLKILYRIKGTGNVAVTTDTSAAMDFGKSRFKFKESNGMVKEFEVRDNVLWAAGTDQVVGSILAMDRAFINVQSMAGLSPCEAAISCSKVPCDIINLEDRGELRQGAVADIVVMSKDGTVKFTIVQGKYVYKST